MTQRFCNKIAANGLSLDTPDEKIISSQLFMINPNEPISTAPERMTDKKLENLQLLGMERFLESSRPLTR